MSWNEQEFLEHLADKVDNFDRNGAAKLCNTLIAVLQEGTLPSEEEAKRILQTLRRKCYFDLMERVSEALRFAGRDEFQIRRQYAQSLIDQGKISPAVDVLEALVLRTAGTEPKENAEAQGLLGRIYKQLYVNAVNADSKAKNLRLSQLNLQRAVNAYHGTYRSSPAKFLWHGINAVALILRAHRDDVPLKEAPVAEVLARDILKVIASKPEIDAWDMATAAEANVALGDFEQALIWIARYVRQEAADLFELSSTERQLREVWNLTIKRPPGSLLLPLLQAQMLQKRGGRVDLTEGTLATTIRKTEESATNPELEKILGIDGVVTLRWFQMALERCRGVAQIRTSTGEAIGTGFLVQGKDLKPVFGEELLLLTNAHVISNDSNVQKDKGSLAPEDAVVFFEALGSDERKEFRVGGILWTSPPNDLDATLLRLDAPCQSLETFPVTALLPLADGKQKVYIIGHPGGRTLSLSLHDNLLLAYNDRLLHYRAPTEAGSSGSPVFNSEWKLIGLHHAGGYALQRLDGQPGTYAANEGIWIQRIVEAIRASPING
jgi:V8-like Glu-specific endopeptidase